jgi:hypothetical protein
MIKFSFAFLQVLLNILALGTVFVASFECSLFISFILCLPQVFRRFFANLTNQARSIRILAGPPVILIGVLMPNPYRLKFYIMKCIFMLIGILNIPQKSKGFNPIRRKIHGYAMKIVAIMITL